MQEFPQVIFFDAVGTLFGVQGSVGEIYSRLAQQAGIVVDPVELDRAFIQSFRAAPRAAFPGVAPQELTEREFAWWHAIAQASFQQIGVLDQFSDFTGFFQELFDHFATATPWFVYDEVQTHLKECQAAGIQLGIISNFDSRLHQVLEKLDLAQFFTSVTISTAVGTAKPGTAVFEAALQQQNCLPTSAWHVGDSYIEDYQGAISAGLRGIWLNRSGSITTQQTANPVDTISQLTLSPLLKTQSSKHH